MTPPLLGGQGRLPADIENSAWFLVILIVLFAVLLFTSCGTETSADRQDRPIARAKPRPQLTGEIIRDTAGYTIFRAPTPTGWLVWMTGHISGAAHVPDPTHEWEIK